MLVKQQSLVLILCLSNLFLFVHPEEWEENNPFEPNVTIAYTGESQEDSRAVRWKKMSRYAQSQMNRRLSAPSRPRYPHPNICVQRINSSPYAVHVYNQTSNVHACVNNVNNGSLPTRIKARILLLESVLPPPYGKKLKQALKRFRKKAASSDGDLLATLEHIDPKLFKDFLQYASLHPQLFHEDLHEIEKHKNSDVQGAYRTPKSSFLIDMIDHQAEWSYDHLTRVYQESLYSITS